MFNNIKEAWIQINEVDGQIMNQGNYTAYFGFKSLGIKTNFYSKANEYIAKCNTHPLEHLCVGGINTIREICKLRSIDQPKIHSPHIHLPNYLFRKVSEINLSDIRENKITFPCFIKPLYADKVFTGFVAKGMMDLVRLRSLPNDFQLLASEVVNYISEYRIFISNKKIIGAKNYTGNFKIIPEFELIEYAIDDYKEQKAAYSLDFGITDTGATMIIEINDAFGISPYGLEPMAYIGFLKTRWDEMMKDQ